jgi:hypothetical protein
MSKHSTWNNLELTEQWKESIIVAIYEQDETKMVQ